MKKISSFYLKNYLKLWLCVVIGCAITTQSHSFNQLAEQLTIAFGKLHCIIIINSKMYQIQNVLLCTKLKHLKISSFHKLMNSHSLNCLQNKSIPGRNNKTNIRHLRELCTILQIYFSCALVTIDRGSCEQT